MVVAICVDLEHHAIIIGASNFSRPIQGSVTSLNDTGINIGTVIDHEIEAIEHLEVRAVCIDLEYNTISIVASTISRPIQSSILALNDTGIGIGTITAIEAMEHLEFGAIGVDLEHHAIIIGASTISRPIQSSILALNDTGRGLGAVEVIEVVDHLKVGAVRVDLEYDTIPIGASILCRPIQGSIFALNDTCRGLGAVGVGSNEVVFYFREGMHQHVHLDVLCLSPSYTAPIQQNTAQQSDAYPT